MVPIVKADLLLTLARRGAFHPLWSDAIMAELSRAMDYPTLMIAM
ncbi:hypothetical protein MHAE_11691 [Mycobacterium haemophilum DSM 44634]